MSYLSRGFSPVINHAPRTLSNTARRDMCAAESRGSRIRSQLRTVTRETRHAVAISGIPTPAITIAARVLPEKLSLTGNDTPLCSQLVLCGLAAFLRRPASNRAGFHAHHQNSARSPIRIRAYAMSCQQVRDGGVSIG